jgi:hypothetical protein
MNKQPNIDTTNASYGSRVTDYVDLGGSYFCYAVWTRDNCVSWFVEDRTTLCELTDLPVIVRQEANFADAIADFVF